MSAIFIKLRLLEAKRDSGALSKSEFTDQKAALFDDIPDAFETEPFEATPAKPTATLWDTLLLWVVGAALCSTFTWAVTGNIGMASTLGVTILAAFTIKLFIALD
jgi:hypothetical protein